MQVRMVMMLLCPLLATLGLAATAGAEIQPLRGGTVVSGPGIARPTPMAELPAWFEFESDHSVMTRAEAPEGDYVVQWELPAPAGAEAARVSAELQKANRHQSNGLRVVAAQAESEIGSNRGDRAWEQISGEVWPLAKDEAAPLRVQWRFRKPHEGDIWRTGIRNLELGAGDAAAAALAWRQPLAEGLPPPTDPTEREPWTSTFELRNNMLLKDGEAFFPIGFGGRTDERALAQARAMGATASHFEIGWRVAPGPGPVPAGQFDRTVDQIRRARAWGMASFPLLTGHYIPGWFQREHPEADARPMGSDGKPTGSWFRYSLHYPPFREHIPAFWKSAAVTLGREAGVVALNHWNEPSYGGTWNKGDQFGDYSQWGLENYRAFLKEKYKTVAALSRAHKQEYAGFDELQPPRAPEEQTRQAWLEWMEYGQQVFAGFFDWERQIIHQANPDVLLANKLQTNPWDNSTASSGTNWHRMNAAQDIFGINTYGGSAYGNRNKLDGARSYAQGKPVMIFEVNVMPPNAEARTAERVRGQLWSLLVGGARGVFIFAMLDRQEHGMLDDRAIKAEVRPEYTRYVQTIADHQRQLASPTVPARVAVVYSTTGVLQYTRNVIPKYASAAFSLLRNSHYQADFLPEERVNAEGLSDYELIVLPTYCVLKPDAIEAVNKWVDGGGKILAFGKSLATDQFLDPIEPPRALGIESRKPPIGDRSDQTVSTLDPGLEPYVVGEIAISGVELVSAMPANQNLIPGAEIKTSQKGHILANNSDSYPAIIQDPSGRIVYCAFETSSAEPLRGAVEGILRERMDLTQEVRLARDGVAASTIMTSLRQDWKDANRRYLLGLSSSPRNQTVDVEILEPGWRVEREFFHKLKIKQSDDGTQIEVPANEVFLLELVRDAV